MNSRNASVTTKSVLLIDRKGPDAANAGLAPSVRARAKTVRMSLSFHPVSNRSCDGFFVCFATEGSNDFSGGLNSDSFDALDGTSLDLSDGGFGFRGFCSNLRISFGDSLIQVCLDFRTGLSSDALSLCTGVRQGLIISGFGLDSFGLQVFGCSEVVGNGSLTLGQHCRNARQRDARQDKVDHDERDHEPEDLVRIGREVQLRHAARTVGGLCGTVTCVLRLSCHVVLLGNLPLHRAAQSSTPPGRKENGSEGS
mmetsp:Transcript_29673/g.38811  ORF Transcript_29673/g.38811 Transcript_29673/m.38811 type:complete len:254 (-) Transcript_29673:268-1029(-)